MVNDVKVVGGMVAGESEKRGTLTARSLFTETPGGGCEGLIEGVGSFGKSDCCRAIFADSKWQRKV